MTRKHPAAVALGSIRTKRKAEAARRNGRKGGRPTLEAKLTHWRRIVTEAAPASPAYRQAARQAEELERRLTRKANPAIVPQQPSKTMNPITDQQRALEQDILRLIDDARYAMAHADGMCDSDIQGCAMAIARRYVK